MPESARLRGWLERRWYGGTAPLLLAAPAPAVRAGRCSCAALPIRSGWLIARHPGVPVMVVGNLTVGGTGKTPLVIWLARQLRAAGQRAGRGAARLWRPRASAAPGGAPAMSPQVVGDEAVLIARRAAVPVAVGADRAAAAQLLAGRGCTLVLADDGLQHLALRRDLAIAVVDGARGFGNGALLPAGPLREPARHAGCRWIWW